MIVDAIQSRLGRGLYSQAEAAYYASINCNAVRRWLYDTARTESVLQPEYGQGDRQVSFLDFVQLFILARARDHGVTMPRIRRALSRAKAEGHEYPLARENVCLVFDQEIYTGATEDELEQFTSYTGQGLLYTIAQPYSKRIDFNQEGFAESFILAEKYGIPIRMDPRHGFGLPLVADTGYPSYVLANAATAEGSVPRAARIYDVDEVDIRAAVALHNELDEAA